MTEIRRADPAVRRRAVGLLLLGTLVGALLLAAFERYRPWFRDWLGSDPRMAPQRMRLALLLLVVFLVAPVIGFAIHYWRLGTHVLRTGQFPPPGYPVMRDTTVLEGPGAVWRGRAFQFFAVALGVAAVVLWLFLWGLARMLAPGST
jgi:hypothetical protein